MTIIYQNEKSIFFEASEVFEVCKSKLGSRIKQAMYMGSSDEKTHYFKDSQTRETYTITVD